MWYTNHAHFHLYALVRDQIFITDDVYTICSDYHPHDSSLHRDLLLNISTNFIQYLLFYPVVHQIRTLSNQGGLASLILGDLECAVPLARGTERLSLFRYVHLKI